MNIQKLASGSDGNAYILNQDIMIECGLPIKTLQKKSGYMLHEIQACLVSHAHFDHSKAMKDLSLRGIPIYASAGTYEALDLLPEATEEVSSYRIAKAGVVIEIGNYKVLPFEVVHDHPFMPCKEPLGFLIQHETGKLVYITDTRYSLGMFKDITHYMIECNHSEVLIEQSLQRGTINKALYDRIRLTHFALEQVKEFFKATDLTKCREIHLIHISQNNGHPESFKDEIEELTGIPVYI
jgi:phosphoribosyl 1,2-cyclic phosphodiesterase